MEWSKKQTLELIDHLHGHECLWNVKNDFYKDRQVKKDALAAIAFQMNLNVNDIDKKIINLKNQFNREINKMKSKSGSGSDEVYNSPWYAFKPLGFLITKNLFQPARSSDGISEEQNDNLESNFNVSLIEEHDIPTISETSDVLLITEKKGVKRRKSSDDRQIEALSILKEGRDNIMTHPAKDEFDVFGEYVAIELRGVTSKRNVLELKKKIQDLIYLTKLNEINYEDNVSSQSDQERLSEQRVLSGDHQYVQVAANMVLKSETQGISDL